MLEREAKLIKQLTDDKRSIIFGSDAHNTDTRRPNWDIILERCDPEILKASNDLLEPVINEVIGEG